MNVIAKTRKSHSWNEDRYIIGDSFYIVIDGATPLIKKEKKNLACWMVSYVKKYINRYHGPIKERLEKLSKDAYYYLGIETDDTAHLPSASISYLEQDEEYYYASVCGDCEVTFRMKSGEVIRCYTDELTHLDAISINELITAAKTHNIHVVNARTYITDRLIKNRRMLNKPNGYNAFTISPNLELKPKTFKIKKEDVLEIYLYSDGFSQAFEFLNIYENHLSMFSKSLDLEEEIKKIEKTSFEDKYCDKHPRFKKIDDITAIKIELD